MAGFKYSSINSPSQAIKIFCGRHAISAKARDAKPKCFSTKVKSKAFKPPPPCSTGILQAYNPASILFFLISSYNSFGKLFVFSKSSSC